MMPFPSPSVVFPFKPNWIQPFSETFTFRSWVLPAAQGNEQSGSISGPRARRRFDYEMLLHNTHAQRLNSLLFSWMGRHFEVPHWADKTTLDAAAALGATVLTIDTTYRSFEVGGKLALYRDDTDYESHEIAAKTATTVTLATPVEKAWPVGSRVYPVLPGLANTEFTGATVTDQLVRMPAMFDMEPSATPSNIPQVVAPLTYRGHELYLGRLNWREPLQIGYGSDREDIDYGTGRIEVYSVSQHAVRTRRHNWQLRSREEAYDFRAWIGRRQGRAVPVYMPSGFSDFTLVAPVAAGNAFLDVTDNLYGELAGAHPALRDVIVQCRDGRNYARRITLVTSLGNGNVRLSLDAAMAEAVTLAQVKRVSYLGLYRQAMDGVTIRWLTETIGVVDCDLVQKYTAD